MSLIQKIHNQLRNGSISCVSLIQQKLAELQKNEYNSVNLLLEKTALDLAKQVDEKIANGEKIGLLEGIPFGLKDVYMLQGTVTTSSSKMLKNYKSPYTATAIQKLLDAGAIPIVKENCDAFGHGSSSENTIFGNTKNAWDKEKVAGGSSGGSAVNVAKNYTTFSIGGDTGGSIRQPAGYNKIYGLKPTYGRVSRYGLHAYASSTDCVGTLTQSLEDTRIVLNTISGKDEKDQSSIDSQKITETEITKNNLSKKIGYFKNFIDNEFICSTIRNEFLNSLDSLKKQGYEIQLLDFYPMEILVSTYYTLVMAETASNLSRLEGSHYGERIENENLKESYLHTRSENFSTETQRRIIGGNQILSAGFSESIYLKALAIRNDIGQKFEKYFETVTAILSPVTPQLPPKIGTSLQNPHEMYLSDAYTVGFSLAQIPTFTIPKGTAVGLQISTNKQKDASLLQIANHLDKIL